MNTYTKKNYTISEVSKMLDVPIYTLRFWEKEFPMFNPHRTEKGTRKFTPTDIDMAKAIKDVVYGKGMKLEGAVAYLNKTYRSYPPRRPRTCNTSKDALILLEEVKLVLEDAHHIAWIDAVEKWIQNNNS